MKKISNKKVENGYVGVSKMPYTRWREHQSDAKDGGTAVLHKAIRKHGVYDYSTNPKGLRFEVLYDDATPEEAYGKEKDLRPRPLMGLNEVSGGNMPFSNMYGSHSVYYIYRT